MSGANEDVVQLGPQDLQDLLGRLQEKRTAVEREYSAIPAAPKAAKDIFQLCRGFERAFSETIDSVDYSALIRGAFTGDDGLKGTVNRMPIEKRFKLDNVKAVCREADGFQKSLVSPEFGLRRLVSDSVEAVNDPVSSAVLKIHLVLIDASREAARKASAFADVKASALRDTRQPLQLPGFEKQVLFAARQALEAWREEALAVAKTLVSMEQSYVTAAFFRHRTRERYQQMMAQQLAARELMDGGGVPVPGGSDSDDEESNPRRSMDSSPSLQRHELQTYSATSSLAGPLAGGLTIPQQPANDDPGELKTGYLEKRVGEHSGRQSVPGEAFKWQKRYFVLTEPKGMLYYFKSADDPPNYRGVINLKECRVEDVDVNGMPRTTAVDAASVSLLIKIGHRDTTRPIVKNHHSVVLRAESAAEKYSWLARLKNASDPNARSPIKHSESQKMRPQEDPKAAPKKDKVSASPEPTYSAPRTPHAVQNSGFGSSVLFHESSGIGPEPVMYNSPQGGGNSIVAQDEFLRQLAEDTAAYVRTVCNTLVLTVPKAIVHCQVKRAQTHLLEALYAHISGLNQLETETMLEEDQAVIQRRAAAKKALADLEDAAAEVKNMLEQPQDKGSKGTPVATVLLELAGMRKLIPAGQRSERGGTPYGDYAPAALSNGSPDQLRRGSGSGSRRSTYADNTSPRVAQPVQRTTSGAGNGGRVEKPPTGRDATSRRPAAPPPTASTGPSLVRTSVDQVQSAQAGGSPGVVPRRRPPPAPPGSQGAPPAGGAPQGYSMT